MITLGNSGSQASDNIDRFLNEVYGTQSFETVPLAGDASARRYFRVISGDDSTVLMVWDPFEDNGHYPFLNIQQHFESHQIAVPKVIALKPSSGLVLLEDLGDLTLERKFWENQNQEHSLPFYQEAIDQLVKIHYNASYDRATHCVAFDISFDTAKLLWEMNYGREHLLEGLCKIRFSEKSLKELEATFFQICQTLDAEPKLIAHRDFHSRNVMLKHGKARIIDFQDARMGAIQYDLVSLLKDSYVSLSDESIAKLLNYYLEKRQDVLAELKENKSDLSIEKFQRVFEIQTIQRCFKACGSFASFYMLRHDTRYLKYLAPTLKTVRSCLSIFPEYSVFLRSLEDNGVFEYSFDHNILV